MNKRELIAKVNNLDGLTTDEKSALIELINTKKRYGLVWEDKPEDVEKELISKLPVLVEVKDKAILAEQMIESEKQSNTTNDTDATELFSDLNQSNQSNQLDPGSDNVPNHLLIEGDNLHALTVLNYTHEGKIDVIYIDPPYNTGNKDFKYNDRFVDKEDSYRHSKWLSFMYKRLVLARSLLKDSGIIFISIDDNEQAQLKLLCDQIFGENTFVANIIRLTTKRVKGDSDQINKIHDYILTYSKSTSLNINHKEKEDYGIYKFEDEFVASRGRYLIRPLDNGTINYSKKLDYEILAPDGSIIVAGGDIESRRNRIKGNHSKKDWCFRWSEVKFKWGIDNGFIIFKKNDDKYRVYFKIYQFVDNNLKTTIKYDNFVSVIDNFYNNQGTTEVKNIVGGNMFTYPKPISLIKDIIFMSKRDSIILDFFAGSGTTLHATMQLNAEDGGSRQCILVTNNENKIAEEVCYERNKRVIQGYTKPNGEKVLGLTNNNFRYYKTDFVPSAKTEVNRRKLTAASTELLQIKENCYFDITSNGGIDKRFCSISSNGYGKYLIVVYHSRKQLEVIEQLVSFIKTLDDISEKIRVYSFSSDADLIYDDFYGVSHLIDAVPLPDAIYNAYRNTFKTINLEKKYLKNVNNTEQDNDNSNESTAEVEP